VESGIARNGDLQIAYEDFGKSGGRALLLISGLDDQMISSWPDGLCEALVGAGFHVVRYDHRDAGLSTHFTGRKKAYELTDMIDDMMAVLDAMGWESASLAGLSMGGALAQFAALLHPQRVRTLTAISSIPQSSRKVLGTVRYMRFPGPFKLVFRRYGDSHEGQQRMTMDIIRLRGQEPAAGRRVDPPDSSRSTAPPRPGPVLSVPPARRRLRRETPRRRVRSHHSAGPGDQRRRGPTVQGPRRGPGTGQDVPSRPLCPGAPHGTPGLGPRMAGTGHRDQPARHLIGSGGWLTHS
jgi:pimeloyl-ACP methyl ester carboxylesterase